MTEKRTGLWYSCGTRAVMMIGSLALAVYLLAALIGG